ncbi:ferritin [Jejubacter calystegiae]|uniref:Ferritin n=2 Tax=Enterobacteriaceae TaxID=543 RepID=A0A4P8YM58_9ENTR|nr:ferritin [Jejubacter calystegiae]
MKRCNTEIRILNMSVAGIHQKLNTQIEREFHASHLYMRLSSWSAEQSLNGLSCFLRSQAQECITQMMQVFNYMKRAGANPIIGTVAPESLPCDSLEHLFEQLHDEFQRRDETLNQLSQASWAARDFTTLAFITQLMGQQQLDKARLESLRHEIFQALAQGQCIRQAGLN